MSLARHIHIWLHPPILIRRTYDEWKEKDHPRGQPGNAGQFGSGSGSKALPAKPIVKSATNQGAQKHIDKLESLAKAGKWGEIASFKVKGTNTYAKMINKYAAALAAHGGATGKPMPTEPYHVAKAKEKTAAPISGSSEYKAIAEKVTASGFNSVGSTTFGGESFDWYILGSDTDALKMSVLINPDTGKWQIWKKGEEPVQGQGQSAFNSAFEKLHPRDTGGKFIAKVAGMTVHDIPGLEIGPEQKKSTGNSYFDLGNDNTLVLAPNAGKWLIWGGIPGGNTPIIAEGFTNAAGAQSKMDAALAAFAASKPAESASPKPSVSAPPKSAVGEPLDTTGWEKLSDTLGTTPGGKYKAPDGKEYYVKQQDVDHSRNEALAAGLFALAGGNTFTYHLTQDGGLATEWQKVETDKVADFTPAQRKAMQNDFAIHAWLANWDVGGAGPEKPGANLGIVDGKVTPLDLGGALLYRGMGQPKGVAFGENPTEWTKLRDPYTNKTAAANFADMTPEQLKASADRLKAVSDEDVRTIVAQQGPGDAGARAALAVKLIARKAAIIKLGDASVSPPGPPATPKVKPLHTTYSSWDAAYHARLAAAPEPTVAEASAIGKYSGGAYDSWNAALRGSFGESAGSYADDTKLLNAWLDRASFPEDGVVRRRVSNSFAKYLIKEAISDSEGGVDYKHLFVDHGYASTDHWSGQLTCEIAIPKGAMAAAIGHYSQHPGENEILIRSESKFRIDSYDKSTSTMKMTLVRSGPSKWHLKKGE